MYDLIIIGAGPAGLTAGLYAGRFRLKALILEKISIGGQIILSPAIENFPGFPGGIATQDLIERLKKQVDAVGVAVAMEEAVEVLASFKLERALYHIKTKDRSYESKSIIIATGAQARPLGVEGEKRFVGRGVSYCATCDAPFFKGKDVIVVGGGDRAIEEAIYLSGYAKSVTLVHRRQELRASRILEEKASANKKINFVLDSIVEEIQGENKVEVVKVKNIKTGALNNIVAQGIFIFVGIQPNTDFIKNLLQVDEAGFIITDQDLKTSKDGIFACGDCRKKNLYQVINACAEAAVAADGAHKYLLSKSDA